MATATLKVTGMSCGHCVQAVTNALKNTKGVQNAQVDLSAGKATVEYEAGTTNPRELANAVMDEGYTAEEMV
jgi:copper chaperone CopZ